MPKFTEEQEKLVQNHIPSVQRACGIFLDVFSTEAATDSKKKELLLAMIDSMKKSLKEVNDMLKTIE